MTSSGSSYKPDEDDEGTSEDEVTSEDCSPDNSVFFRGKPGKNTPASTELYFRGRKRKRSEGSCNRDNQGSNDRRMPPPPGAESSVQPNYTPDPSLIIPLSLGPDKIPNSNPQTPIPRAPHSESSGLPKSASMQHVSPDKPPNSNSQTPIPQRPHLGPDKAPEDEVTSEDCSPDNSVFFRGKPGKNTPANTELYFRGRKRKRSEGSCNRDNQGSNED